jgi:hypothetical protein
MQPPKVGLITFGDNRKHEWEHYFRGLTEPRHQEASAFFQTLPLESSVPASRLLSPTFRAGPRLTWSYVGFSG